MLFTNHMECTNSLYEECSTDFYNAKYCFWLKYLESQAMKRFIPVPLSFRVAGAALKARYDQKVARTYGKTCNRNVLPLKNIANNFLYAGKMTFLDRNVVSRCAVRILVA